MHCVLCFLRRGLDGPVSNARHLRRAVCFPNLVGRFENSFTCSCACVPMDGDVAGLLCSASVNCRLFRDRFGSQLGPESF